MKDRRYLYIIIINTNHFATKNNLKDNENRREKFQ